MSVSTGDSDRDTLMKKRAAKRGWLTRAIERLSLILTKVDVYKEEIEQGVCEVHKYFDSIQEIQEHLELFFDASELETEFDEAEEYIEKYNSAIAAANHRIGQLTVQVPDSQPSSTVGFDIPV